MIQWSKRRSRYKGIRVEEAELVVVAAEEAAAEAM
jgi:hypothetical protein